MINLPLPLPDITPERIFEECANGYHDEGKRRKLKQYKGCVENDSEVYGSVVTCPSGAFSFSAVPDDDIGILSALYTEKFAKGPGRRYYDQIIRQAPLGICPICGISMAETLDHYLPKSKFPTLSVTPANLIPACRDCNTRKGNNSAPIVHLYLDIVPNGDWLHVKLDEELTPVYYVSCSENWDMELIHRMESYFNVFRLGALYAAHAAQEIAGKIYCWRVLSGQGLSALEDAIKLEADGLKHADRNSWKAALYRSLKENARVVEAYLSATSPMSKD